MYSGSKSQIDSETIMATKHKTIMFTRCIAIPRHRAAIGSLLRRNSVAVVALSGGVDSSVATALALLQQQQQQQQHHQQQHNQLSQLRARTRCVEAIHMSNWDASDDDSLHCTKDRDWEDAVAVAQHLSVKLHRVSFANDYWVTVFEPFLQQLYETACMGNPDVACNTNVKFGSLINLLHQRYGHDFQLLTGHYARLWHRLKHHTDGNPNSNISAHIPCCIEEALEEPRLESLSSPHERLETLDWLREWGSSITTSTSTPPLLLAAADDSKDQSYFLSGCPPESFRNVIFPLGDYFKTKSNYKEANHNLDHQLYSSKLPLPSVRQIASKLKLPSASKRESMGLCFVGTRAAGFHSFLEPYLPPPQYKLQFVDIDTGVVLHQTESPEHHQLYTIGQGAKLGGMPTKYFVVSNLPSDKSNGDITEKPPKGDDGFFTITLCAGTNHPALYRNSLTVDNMNWFGTQPPPPLVLHGALRCHVRTRHLHPLVPCTLRFGYNNHSIHVQTDVPVRAIAPGQHAVFYALDGLVCLGGGPIARPSISETTNYESVFMNAA